jgi:hypothetical protein
LGIDDLDHGREVGVPGELLDYRLIAVELNVEDVLIER